MATFWEDQCIALIVQDTLKLPLPQPGQGWGWGQVDPPGNGALVESASFLEGARLRVPTSGNNFPSPSPLQCLTALLPNPGAAGTPGSDSRNYRARPHPLPTSIPKSAIRDGMEWLLLIHIVHFIASSLPDTHYNSLLHN